MNPFQNKDNKQFLENMYQHTRYTNNVKKHQVLTLFVQPSQETFSLILHQPLQIDTISDVYLDNFTTFDIGTENSSTTNSGKQFFVLKIDQFNLNSISNRESFNNAIIIPNDETSGVGTVKVHKGKKMNYVTTLMPGTIEKISGTITDWHGDLTFQDATLTINDIPSTTELTLIIKRTSTGGGIAQGQNAPNQPIVTLTSDSSAKGTGRDVSDNTGRFSGSGTTTEVATAIAEAISKIDLRANVNLGYSLNASNNVVTITKEPLFPSVISIDGTYTKDSSNLSHSHPHFLTEFLIVNRD